MRKVDAIPLTLGVQVASVPDDPKDSNPDDDDWRPWGLNN